MCFISGILGLAALVMPLSYGQVLGRNLTVSSIVISQQGIAATGQVLASAGPERRFWPVVDRLSKPIRKPMGLAVTEPI